MPNATTIYKHAVAGLVTGLGTAVALTADSAHRLTVHDFLAISLATTMAAAGSATVSAIGAPDTTTIPPAEPMRVKPTPDTPKKPVRVKPTPDTIDIPTPAEPVAADPVPQPVVTDPEPATDTPNVATTPPTGN